MAITEQAVERHEAELEPEQGHAPTYEEIVERWFCDQMFWPFIYWRAAGKPHKR